MNEGGGGAASLEKSVSKYRRKDVEGKVRGWASLQFSAHSWPQIVGGKTCKHNEGGRKVACAKGRNRPPSGGEQWTLKFSLKRFPERGLQKGGFDGGTQLDAKQEQGKRKVMTCVGLGRGRCARISSKKRRSEYSGTRPRMSTLVPFLKAHRDKRKEW